MALKPMLGQDERRFANYRICNVAANAGALVTRDSTDTSPLGPGTTPYGNVALGSVSVAGDRELGVMFYPVSTNGVTLFDQLANRLNYTGKVGDPCVYWATQPGDEYETTEYASSGTGAIVAGAGSGNTAIDSQLGIINGKYVLLQGSGAGSVPRAVLIGNGVLSDVTTHGATLQAIRVRVL